MRRRARPWYGWRPPTTRIGTEDREFSHGERGSEAVRGGSARQHLGRRSEAALRGHRRQGRRRQPAQGPDDRAPARLRLRDARHARRRRRPHATRSTARCRRASRSRSARSRPSRRARRRWAAPGGPRVGGGPEARAPRPRRATLRRPTARSTSATCPYDATDGGGADAHQRRRAPTASSACTCRWMPTAASAASASSPWPAPRPPRPRPTPSARPTSADRRLVVNLAHPKGERPAAARAAAAVRWLRRPVPAGVRRRRRRPGGPPQQDLRARGAPQAHLRGRRRAPQEAAKQARGSGGGANRSTTTTTTTTGERRLGRGPQRPTCRSWRSSCSELVASA